MLLFIKDIIEAYILPPGICVIFLLAIFILLFNHKIIAGFLLLLSIGFLYILSIPWGANKLITALQTYKAVDLTTIAQKFSDVGAIVVLSGGKKYNAPEYGVNVANSSTLVRLRYAARLAKHVALPILLTGSGDHYDVTGSDAALMKDVMVQDFGIQREYLLEEKSHTTKENAKFTAAILKNKSISKIYLVTHGWHMPRAVMEFERAGLKVIAAPTGFYVLPSQLPALMLWVPQFSAFQHSYIALHEYLGIFWYKLLGKIFF